MPDLSGRSRPKRVAAGSGPLVATQFQQRFNDNGLKNLVAMVGIEACPKNDEDDQVFQAVVVECALELGRDQRPESQPPPAFGGRPGQRNVRRCRAYLLRSFRRPRRSRCGVATSCHAGQFLSTTKPGGSLFNKRKGCLDNKSG